MANTVEIIIKAIDQASGNLNKATTGLDKFKAGFKSLTGISLTAAGGIAAAGMAINKVIDFTKQAVQETVDYATSIDRMSRLLGTNTEETSRLVQASDDLFISQENLQTALLAATRKGIDVSTESLKNLSTQYLQLNPGIERGKFLMDTFGRSGAEMGKLMEKGADGIQSATDAIDDSLIITDQSMENVMNYKRSVDMLTDAWQGFKYQIGEKVIPQLDLLIRQMTKGKDEIEIEEERINDLNFQLQNLKKYGAQGGLSQEELAKQIAEVNRQLELTPSATGELVKSLYGLQQTLIPVTAYMSDLTTEMLFNQAAAGLDSEAAMMLAEAMGLINPRAANAMDTLQDLRDKLDNGTITIDQYTAAIKRMNDALLLESGGVASVGPLETKLGMDLNGNGIIGRWGGGPVYSNTPYLVGERGPELFVPNGSGNIIPNNKMSGKTVNLYGDTYFSVENDLTDDLLQQLRIT